VTPGEWQCKTGGVWRLAVANGPNIFQMLLVCNYSDVPRVTDIGRVSYIRISLFRFPVKDGKLSTGVSAQHFLSCYG